MYVCLWNVCAVLVKIVSLSCGSNTKQNHDENDIWLFLMPLFGKYIISRPGEWTFYEHVNTEKYIQHTGAYSWLLMTNGTMIDIVLME